MVSRRRRLLTSGGIAGAFGLLAPRSLGAEPAGAQGPVSASMASLAEQLSLFVADLRSEWRFSDIGPIRDSQKTYLRANGKLPDFIEVGADLWFAVYDWHVRWQQSLAIGRDGNGRHTIVLLLTTLILRADLAANFISLPYDNK